MSLFSISCVEERKKKWKQITREEKGDFRKFTELALIKRLVKKEKHHHAISIFGEYLIV